MPCSHRISEAVNIARATWVCPDCREDISLLYVLYHDSLAVERMHEIGGKLVAALSEAGIKVDSNEQLKDDEEFVRVVVVDPIKHTGVDIYPDGSLVAITKKSDGGYEVAQFEAEEMAAVTELLKKWTTS